MDHPVIASMLDPVFLAHMNSTGPKLEVGYPVSCAHPLLALMPGRLRVHVCSYSSAGSAPLMELVLKTVNRERNAKISTLRSDFVENRAQET